MSRLSFRPRPLDIHKKLLIFRSTKDFEDDETPTSTRNSQTRLTLEIYNEAQQNASKKTAAEIPIPQFVVVDTYERDYSCTFKQLTSYIHARGARSEIGEFVEYDLDNEDEDWLEEFNNGKKILTSEKFESLLFKLDVLDHKARERAGVIIHSLGSPVPVFLNLDTAAEAVKSLSVKYAVLQSVFIYWKEKRERWKKPILRRLQPPPSVNDTNPYNVFRPREKAHRLHTRRMQRRENNVQSFQRLRQIRRNLEQAKIMLEALTKREEKKREVMESEVNLQRIQMKYKNETQLIDDGMALSNFTSFSYKLSSSEDEHDLGDMVNDHPRIRMKMNAIEKMKRDTRGRTLQHKWFRKKEPLEPVLLFTRDLNPERLASVGITSPSDRPIENGSTSPLYHFRGRIGRGGRIIFDRCHTLVHSVNDMSHRPPNT